MTGSIVCRESRRGQALSGFAREALTPDMRDGDTFAAQTTAPDGANALVQLVAFSGRVV